MDATVLQTFALGPQWPTLDPFLFCAHHDDHYPAGTADLAPDASLAGRTIGSDFSGTDGWSMYHGSAVPGFPQHPHRGFETISYVRHGLIDHADSLGATARFGAGDVQWMTAGSGIQHCEMFPLVNADAPNRLTLFQVWLNLPAADKMVDPYFTMLWDETVPKVRVLDADDRACTVTVVAGRYGDAEPGTPPPDSWAAKAESDLAFWHLDLEPGASFSLPAAAEGSNRVLYLFDGGAVRVGETVVEAGHGAVVAADTAIDLRDLGDGSEIIVLQGRPIGEPVAQYGPFVMNTKAEIQTAFDDYQRTQFGGWPWPSPDPNHGPERGRFALHADGRVEELDAAATP